MSVHAKPCFAFKAIFASFAFMKTLDYYPQ